jgi:hypothetical protein
MTRNWVFHQEQDFIALNNMENQSKPTTAFTNADKTSIGETWGSIPNTWGTETRTWEYISKIFNEYVDFGFLWGAISLPWQKDLPWQTLSNIINSSKP